MRKSLLLFIDKYSCQRMFCLCWGLCISDAYVINTRCFFLQKSKEPFMFSAEIVSLASSLQAPFVQCTKQFHNVALADLHGRLNQFLSFQEIEKRCQDKISKDTPAECLVTCLLFARRRSSNLQISKISCLFNVEP